MNLRQNCFLVFLLCISVSCLKEPYRAPISVNTGEASEIKATSVKLHADVQSPDVGEITDRGFYWTVNDSAATVLKNKISLGPGSGEYNYLLKNLQSKKSYSFFSFAISDSNNGQGNVKSFNTLEFQLATLSTDTVKNIGITTALLAGEIKYDGGAIVTDRGFCFSLSKLPSIKDFKISVGKGEGKFAIVASQLNENTLYYVRAFAVNSIGIAYGNEHNFTTLGLKLPTVSTGTILDFTFSKAVANGSLDDDGGAPIVEMGFCVSENPNPTLSDLIFKVSSTKGAFMGPLENLKENTTYYVRAYAKNIKGVAYGNERSFTTLGLKLPTVSTGSITDFSFSAATANGSLDNDGGAPILEMGFCISESINPTLSDIAYKVPTTKGAFKCILDNLKANTKYYVRAYAKNIKGVAYGIQTVFTTQSIKNTLLNGLIAYYPFSGNAKDATQNANHGTIKGAILTTDRFGNGNSAFSFSNGANISVPMVNLLHNLPVRTFSCWFNANGPQNGGRIYETTYLNGGIGMYNGNILDAWYSNGKKECNVTNIKTGALNQWHCLVYVTDCNTGMGSIYLDGIFIESRMGFPNTPPSNWLNNYLRFGLGAQSESFNGKIDDVGIWNRVLTNEEIKDLYQKEFQVN
jgi:hypothetical protein